MTSGAVVVYGKSGPIVDLLSRQLRESGIAVALIEPDPYDTVASLTAQFTGSTVVHNAHWPYAENGHAVVEAALLAGCHYLDTSDGNAWLLKVREAWHESYADAGLLLIPGFASPFATSEIAAHLSLETPGAEILDVLLLWNSFSSPSSAAHLSRVVEQNGFNVRDFREWPLDRTLNVRVPGRSEPGMAIRFQESPHCVWFEDDDRVSELRTYGGASERSALEQLLRNSSAFPTPFTDAGEPTLAADVSVDFVYSEGPNGRTHVVIEGICPNGETAVLHAHAAKLLVAGPPPRAGFTSACGAFGHRALLEALEAANLVSPPIVTINA